MKLLSYWGIPISLVIYCLGVFFGDLGGVGGYDGIAPRWLYEKSINEEISYLFEFSEVASIVLMATSIITFLVVLVLYSHMLGVVVFRRIKSL